MPTYSFVTTWEVDAPVEPVWEAIAHPREWPGWWKGVVSVEELEKGDDDGRGALHRYTWKSALPYRLSFDMRVTTVEEPVRLEGLASGELEGVGVWTFSADGPGTTVVRYEWDIRTTRPWMNAFAPLLRGAFEWNHDWVMRSGARGLARRLGVEVRAPERGRALRAWLPLAGAGAALAAGVVVVTKAARR